MAPAAIQLVFGLLNIWLPLMCTGLAVVALFLFGLHRSASRSAKAYDGDQSQGKLIGKDFPAQPPFVLRSLPVRGDSTRSAIPRGEIPKRELASSGTVAPAVLRRRQF